MRARIGIAVVSLLAASTLSAQIVGIPKPSNSQYRNSLGFGASVGPFLGKDSYFWGLAVDYGRFVSGPWSVAASFAFDRETETLEAGGTQKTDSLSAVGLVNYSISRFMLTSGLSKGFANTDNTERAMQFASGDWGTGIVAGWALPNLAWAVQDSIAFSVGYEYNLSQKESDITFDVGYAFAF
jgi:hypothetical protein